MGEAWDVFTCYRCGKTVGRRCRKYDPREDRPGRAIETVCEDCARKWNEYKKSVSEEFTKFWRERSEFSEKYPLSLIDLAEIANEFCELYERKYNMKVRYYLEDYISYNEIVFIIDDFNIPISFIPTQYKIRTP